MTPRNSTFLEKPLPSSDESERAILGTILVDNRVMSDVFDSINETDFYSPLHRRVYAAMIELHKASRPIDPFLVGDVLKRDGSLETIGGITVIANLTYGLPHYSNVEEYVGIVREKATLREMIRTCNRITEMAWNEEEKAESVVLHAQTAINDICIKAESSDTSNEHFVPLHKLLDGEVKQALDELLGKRTNKIKTGFEPIDEAIGGGVSLSDVLLLVADTGMGKSALALQIAGQIAAQNIPTAFLAGEMTNAENVKRRLSQVSGITNLNWLQHITQDQYNALMAWSAEISSHPLFLEHRISDLHTLATHLRSLVRRQGLKVLVIDYIQLFKMERLDRRKRVERIAEASQEVKRIANEMGLAIIEVAQFNREGAKSGQPGLHDLEGSGQLEKDASLILILELNEMEEFDEYHRKYHRAKIRIVKGRNAGKSTVEGFFYGSSLRFQF